MKIVYGDGMKKRTKKHIPAYVVLHDIRSIHNVGSIFRTADAAGVSRIFLAGYTPTPLDRFGRARGDLAKVALGAEHTVPWEYVKSTGALLKRLKKEGMYIVAIEQNERSIHYKKVHTPARVQGTVFVYGNEVDGVPASLVALCDAVAEIPMAGKKESLNVSVSAGITLFGMQDI